MRHQSGDLPNSPIANAAPSLIRIVPRPDPGSRRYAGRHPFSDRSHARSPAHRRRHRNPARHVHHRRTAVCNYCAVGTPHRSDVHGSNSDLGRVHGVDYDGPEPAPATEIGEGISQAGDSCLRRETPAQRCDSRHIVAPPARPCNARQLRLRHNLAILRLRPPPPHPLLSRHRPRPLMPRCRRHKRRFSGMDVALDGALSRVSLAS